MYRTLSKVNIPKTSRREAERKRKVLPKALSKSSNSNEEEEVKILHDKNLKLNIELKKSQQREIEKTINRIDALIHPEKLHIKRVPRIITKKPITS